MKQTRQAVRAIKQSILLRCLWSTQQELFLVVSYWPRKAWQVQPLSLSLTFSRCKWDNVFIVLPLITEGANKNVSKFTMPLKSNSNKYLCFIGKNVLLKALKKLKQ